MKYAQNKTGKSEQLSRQIAPGMIKKKRGSQPHGKISGIIKLTLPARIIYVMAADRWKTRRDQMSEASFYNRLKIDLALDKVRSSRKSLILY